MKFEILSRQKKYSGLILFDEEDIFKLFNYKWTIVRRSKLCFYATSKSHGKSVYMHQLILPPKRGFIIDHLNANGLDNRKQNLRYATHAENIQRSPPRKGRKIKGVYFDKRGLQKPWVARLNTAKNGNKTLGYYKTEIEAAIAYNHEALKHFGNHAWLNQIDQQTTKQRG